MKILIDTTTSPHRVEIHGDCSIGELTDFLSRFYPDFAWRDIQISAQIKYPQNWGTTGSIGPVGVQGYPGIFGPGTGYNPWYIGDIPGKTITYCSDTNNLTDSAGTVINLTTLYNATK